MPTTNIILLTFQLLLTVLNSGLLDGATIGRPIVEDETTPATTTTTTTTYCPWVKYGCGISMYVICTITTHLPTYLFTKIQNPKFAFRFIYVLRFLIVLGPLRMRPF